MIILFAWKFDYQIENEGKKLLPFYFSVRVYEGTFDKYKKVYWKLRIKKIVCRVTNVKIVFVFSSLLEPVSDALKQELILAFLKTKTFYL